MFPILCSEFKTSKGVSLSIYSSNSHGRSISQVHLETVPSKVAELQVGKNNQCSLWFMLKTKVVLVLCKVAGADSCVVIEITKGSAHATLRSTIMTLLKKG